MRLTIKTDYCLRVLIFLQSNSGKAKIQDIADAYKISKNHLSVVVNKLSELGYVTSTFGPKGGIEFNSNTGDRTIGDLVVEIEDLNVVECFQPETSRCTLMPGCRLNKILQGATEAFIENLEKYKIKDLV